MAFIFLRNLREACSRTLARAEMRISYVIDSQQHRLADVLKDVKACG